MQETYTIHVNEEDIRRGKPGNAVEDAIARAFIRLEPGCLAYTCPAVLIVQPPGAESLWYSLPPKAKEFIRMVDAGNWEDLEPLSFTVKKKAKPRQRTLDELVFEANQKGAGLYR
jgi:hypothetical protein